jgi:hypothetical protein
MVNSERLSVPEVEFMRQLVLSLQVVIALEQYIHLESNRIEAKFEFVYRANATTVVSVLYVSFIFVTDSCNVCSCNM